MKKYLILAILLIASPAWAWTNVINVGGGLEEAAEAGCVADTAFSYNGDWEGGGADDNAACDSDGATKIDGMESGSVSVDSSYVTFSTTNSYVTWVIDSDNIDDEVGTIYCDVYIESSIDGYNVIWESIGLATEDQMYCMIESGTLDFYCLHEGQNAGADAGRGTSALTADAWYRCGFSWQTGVAGNDFAISSPAKGSATAWTESDKDLTAWAAGNQPDDFTIGENVNGNQVTDTVRVRDCVILKTYKATDPDP
jgi:hypothetical protein